MYAYRPIGFVMKSAKWDDDITDFSLSCVTETSTMQSSCILRILIKKDLELFKKRLKAIETVAWYPCFISAILIEMWLHGLPDITSELRNKVYKTEKRSGTHKMHWVSEWKSKEMWEKWKKIDLGRAATQLTSIASDCVYFVSACSTRRRLIQWLDEYHQTLSTAQNSQSGHLTYEILKQKLKFMEMWAHKSENRMSYFGKRAAVQLQMVRFR